MTGFSDVTGCQSGVFCFSASRSAGASSCCLRFLGLHGFRVDYRHYLTFVHVDLVFHVFCLHVLDACIYVCGKGSAYFGQALLVSLE